MFFILGIICLFLLRLAYEYKRDRNLPPGPSRLPLIGNIHQVPQELPWREFDKWSKKYGPIMSAQFGRQTIIFITDTALARELLDKRGSLYSDRPRMVMAGENVTKGLHLLMRPYDERYRLHQRMEAPVLGPRASGTYWAIQDLESKQMLFDLLGSNDFTHHFERYSISLVYALAYGFRLPTGHEQDMKDVIHVMRNFSYAARVGTWIVDAIPALNNLPACVAPWKKIAEELFQVEAKLHMKNMEVALANGPWNWTKEMAKSKQAMEMSPLEFAYSVGILADAGFETTSTTMRVFMLACLAYPGFIQTAQEELDRVVGPDRLPDLSDKENLPYIEAIVEETLRWRSIAPQGVPHAATKDDTVMGYKIPKEATIIPLHWSMSLDEKHFNNPFEFRPERWLAKSDDGRFTNFFGYGRRICTGRHIARNSLFNLIARILWGFNIKEAVGVDGKGIKVDDMAFGSGFVSGPDHFEAVFEPRSQKTRNLIEKEWEGTEKNLDVLMDSVRSHQISLGLDLKA